MKAISIIIVLLFFGCTSKQPLPDLEPELKNELIEYLSDNYMTPEDYVISQFEDHDIIFIGEWHRIKHDVELIQRLIPQLYNNGIYYLATEFARREDQHLIDSLLNSDQYDRDLAEKITFLQSVHWGYEEYIDIYEAAWKLNKTIPQDVVKFKILALNDSPNWSIIKSREDRADDAIKKQVWQGGGEHLWAKTILDSVVANKQKALVYCGLHHAFTKYKQPIYNFEREEFIRFEERRMGNYVYNEIGKRAITICLHAPWVSAEGYDMPGVYPVDGVIDALLRELPQIHHRVGFNVRNNPFGKLTSKTSLYQYGYDDFQLGMLCDGYIIQRPFSAYEGVTPIEKFIDEDNIEYARENSSNPDFRNASVERFNRSIVKLTDLKKRLSHLY